MPSVKATMSKVSKRLIINRSKKKIPRVENITNKAFKPESLKKVFWMPSDETNEESDEGEEEEEMPKPEKIRESLIKPIYKSPLEQALEEIESKGSSSEPENIEEYKEEGIFGPRVETKKNLLIIEDPQKFLECIIKSEEESLSEEDHFQQKNEFKFSDFTEDDSDEESINLEPEPEAEEPLAKPKKRRTIKDAGTFVHPLTGEETRIKRKSQIHFKDGSSSSSEKSVSQKREYKSTRVIAKDKDTFGDEDQHYDDFPQKDPGPIISEFNFFEELEEKKKHIDHKTVEEIKLDEFDKRKLIDEQIIQIFIAKLIDDCITQADKDHDLTVFRQSLDPKKLLLELKAKHDKLWIERKRNDIISRKCVIYLKTKKAYIFITPDESKSKKLFIENYRHTLDILDNLILKEQQLKGQNAAHIVTLTKQFEDIQLKSNEGLNELENRIKSTIQVNPNFYKLEKSINKQLDKMSKVRQEISKVRFKLLLKMSNACALEKEMENLEDLGNGLKLSQYEGVKIETFSLNKKLEERDDAIETARNHCTHHYHHLAHAREKRQLMLKILSEKTKFLDNLKFEHELLRKRIAKSKVQHIKLQAKLKKLSFQGGIIDKPNLMRDFDKTDARSIQLKQTNDELKKDIQNLDFKIKALEKMLKG